MPVDAAFQAYGNPSQLMNFTFLYEILFKSHRISNQILFDYYFDGPQTYYTDTLLPVSTVHRRLPGASVDDISIQIGHVKGKINPILRNILCWSGIIHAVDTVLAIPTLSAYQQISSMPGMTLFKSLIDNSPKYSQLLQQLPSSVVYPTQPPQRNLKVRQKRQRTHTSHSPFNNQPSGGVSYLQNLQQQPQINFNQLQQQEKQLDLNQQQQQQQQQMNPNQQQYQFQSGNNNYASTANIKYLTILAANDAALFNLYSIILSNATAIDQFLSTHIIVDSDSSQNRIFYTDHDANVFQNGQVYTTMNPSTSLVATVTQMPNEVSSSKFVHRP